jgi:hypothetical protein
MGQPRWMLRRPPQDTEQLSGPPTSAFSWPLCCWFYIPASRRRHIFLVPDPLTDCCPTDPANHFEVCVEATTTAPHNELSSPLAPVSSGTRAFGGLNHLEGFLPLPSEGYNISKARTCSMADLLLLRNFSTLYSLFSCLMFSHTSSFLGAYNLCASFISVLCLPPHPPFFLMYFLLAYFSFLFLCAPLCAISLEGYSLVAISFPPPGPSASH